MHKNTYTTFRVLKEDAEKLKIIAALSRESMLATFKRLVQQEYERLHQEGIILAELDPCAIIVSDQNYDGLSALMISWLPLALQKSLPYISTATNLSPTSIAGMLRSAVEKQSDIYSLGALLYLLLTGISPEDPVAATQHLVRSQRNLTPGINGSVDAIIKRTLATKNEEQFQSAAEIADALLELCISARAKQANTLADYYGQTSVLKHSPLPEPGKTLRAGDDGDATIIAPLPQLRRKITHALTSSLKMRVAHMNEASGALEDTEHPKEPQSIIIEELSMGTDPTTETEAMLEPSATKMETVIEPSAEKTKKVIEPATTRAGKAPEPSSEAEMAAPPVTEPGEGVEPPSSAVETVSEPPITETEVIVEPSDVEPVMITEPLLAEAATEVESASLERETEVQTEDEISEDKAAIEFDSSEPQAEEPGADAPPAQAEEYSEPVAVEEQFLQDAQVIEYSLEQEVPLQNGYTAEAADVEIQEEAEPAPAAEPAALEIEPVQEEQSSMQPLPDPSADAEPDSSTISDVPPSLVQRVLGRVSGVLPAIGRVIPKEAEALETPLLKRLQRFVLGEQQHITAAAALIEMPLRIQPNQIYAIRIHMMGRDEPDPGSIHGGLSAVTKGETVHIEVRSALYRNFAYIVQQADVTIPGKGYAAEVTMPMQAFSQGPSGRHERLHIFFMDGARHPLYERPFVIEIFISHLVQSGREGHNVLSIPL